MSEHLEKFELKLQEQLLGICIEQGYIPERPLTCEDAEEKWTQIAPEYMADAIPEIADYPTVAIAWAGYVGMGMAQIWDKSWSEHADEASFYNLFKAPRGFDCLDEYVMEELYGLDLESIETLKLIELFRRLSEHANTVIRKEEVSPQSSDAFYIFTRTTKIFYHLGISIGLKMLGYSYGKVDVPG